MKKFISRLAIVTLLVAGAALTWGAQGAEAINCDSRPTCSCGDDLQFGRTLTGADPVVNTVCTGEYALKIFGGGHITLDLGGRTIRCGGGATATKGIVIGANMVTVQNGTIENCAVGVGTEGPHDNLIITHIRASRNGTGFDVHGSVNRLIDNIAEESIGAGVRADGASVSIQDIDCEQNGGAGIHVSGGNNSLTNNICSYNDGDGILVEGSATLADNQARSNLGRGVFAPDGFRTNPNHLNYGNGNRTAPNCDVGGQTIRKKYC